VIGSRAKKLVAKLGLSFAAAVTAVIFSLVGLPASPVQARETGTTGNGASYSDVKDPHDGTYGIFDRAEEDKPLGWLNLPTE
jgi:hypothetical protein